MRLLISMRWLAIILLAAPLCAQIDNGNITGRVTDPTGAVVADAQVTVVQTAMNFETVVKTNTEGVYRAPSLRPGPYRLTVVATGFKKLNRDNIELHTGETLGLDMVLEVGSVSDSVDVAGNAEMLQTETTSTGTVVEGDYYYRLPNFQRNIKSSMLYTPGLSYSGLVYTGNMNNFHLNGLNYQDVGVFEDGALGTIGDGMTVDTIENTIQEVKVLTTGLPAEYGHSAGGAVSIVKKSGTNAFHGLVSEYGRTRRMQDRKYFDRYQNSQLQPGWTHAPGLISENPDANVSGPVYIPKIYDGRNKTFFMFAWTKYIEKQSKQQVSTVPTLAELGGDFSFGGIGQPVYDPKSTFQDAAGWHRTAFPNNVIPTSQIDAVAKKVLSLSPFLAPNALGTMSQTGPSNNLYTGPMKLVFWDNYSVRLDQQFTSNIKAYASWTGNGRYQRQPPWTITEGSLFDSTNNPSGSPPAQYQNTWSAGTTWIASPTVLNDLRASYYRYNNETMTPTYNQDYASKLGMTGLPTQCMPQIWPGGFTESLNVACPSNNLYEITTVKDDVSKTWGNHSFKFGYELLRYRDDNWSIGTPDGSYSYTGTSGLNTNGTSVSNTGNTLANFLTGAISSVSFSRQLAASLPRVWQHSWYAQDDWRLTSNLTLNIGVRYNIETPVTDKHGLMSVFDPNAPDTSQYTNYTCNNCKGMWTHPKGEYPYNMQFNRIDPRLGLAWHVSPRFVIRSGFGISHTDMRANYLQTNELTSDSTSISQAPGVPQPLFYLQNAVPSYTYPTHRADGSVPYVGNAGGHTGQIVDRNIKDPYTMNWNFVVETQLSKDYMLTTEYKGSVEADMLGTWNLNSMPWGLIPNPNGSGMLNLNDPANLAYRTSWLANTQPSLWWNNWGNINIAGNDGHMDHHEGTVKIEKRFSKGLNFLAFYTFAKSMQLQPPGGANPYLNWGLYKTMTPFNQKHTFTGTMSYELPVGKGRQFINRGGLWNALIGGYDLVWTYTISSGAPLGVSISGSPYSSSNSNYPGYMPNFGNVLLTQDPKLRNNWQDLGGDRFNTNNENSMFQCGVDGSWTALYGNSCMVVKQPFSLGNDNAYVLYQQRVIAATISASKEFAIKERARIQLRWDFQNPFKWYNWGAPSTGLNVATSAASIISKGFGTASSSNEGTTAVYGGAPLMNVTIAVKW